jgi:hypothetical protein
MGVWPYNARNISRRHVNSTDLQMVWTITREEKPYITSYFVESGRDSSAAKSFLISITCTQAELHVFERPGYSRLPFKIPAWTGHPLL